jgi:hypothetical protein
VAAASVATTAFAAPGLPGSAESMRLHAKMLGDQVAIGCGNFELRFAADGKPVSFRRLSDNRDVLDAKNPGDGFVVLNRAGQVTPLGRLRLSSGGDTLTARVSDDGPEVVFRLSGGPDHIGFHVVRLTRFSPVPDLSLALRMNVDETVRAVPHNHMAVEQRRNGQLAVVWPALWTVSRGDSPGGFSLYQAQTPEEEETALLRIWSSEPIAHPQVAGDWSFERAKAWLTEWRRHFIPHRGTIVLEGNRIEDLREGLKYAQAAGVSEVYLMPWVWRGEYWPITNTTAGVNTDIFPRGEPDLKAFAEEVRQAGMHLSFHWVSAGVGFKDPKYVGQHPDRRLASWGSGRLEKGVSVRDTTLRFKPDGGVFAPYIAAPWNSSAAFPPAIEHFMHYTVIRVEDELIRFQSLEDLDQPVWTVAGCQRGYGSTVAASHPDGAEAAGLIVAYNQNFVPDNWSPMLSEMAEAYAGMMNRVGVDRAEFDGMEIHQYYGGTGEKMAALLYAALDHPTTADSSSGRAPRAWFEYRFPGAGMANGQVGTAIVRLREPSANASSLLMANHDLYLAAAQGSLAMGLAAGDRGFHPKAFRGHGLHQEILDRVNLWRAIAGALFPEQRRRMDTGTFCDPNARLSLAGNHSKLPFVYVPEDSGTQWAIFPVKVLDTSNQDSSWYHGQENGPIEPWRFVKPNEARVWTNPFPAQPLRFVIHVLAATDYDSAENLDLLPKAGDLEQAGDVQFTDESDGLRLAVENSRQADVWNEDRLPIIKRKYPLDLTHHRPMGCRIEGDGQNEVLVLQVNESMGRDYTIPIDFKGRRYLEIPHGEASYAMTKWGWRYLASKSCDYSRVTKLRLGFGYLPGNTGANLKITGLKMLQEIPVALIHPVIATPKGTLSLEGAVPSDHYVEYQGEDTAFVYDANWNRVSTLPVRKTDFVMPAGSAVASIKTQQPGPLPWLEVQFLTRGEPMLISKPPQK